METKTSKALELFKKGEYKKAFAIFRTFKINFSKEEKRIIEITNEVISNQSREVFYKSMGIDTESIIEQAKEIIKTKYNL